MVRTFSDAEILDRIAVLLSAEEWPGASGLEDIHELVLLTGRHTDHLDVEWASH
jgi:CO dehydrogenase/acetyl-CoA synthase epsilon subunit